MKAHQQREKLTELRKSREWSQRNFTEQLLKQFNIKISESYYGMIEKGVRTPSLEIAIAIALVLDVPVDEIFFATKPNESLGDVYYERPVSIASA